MATKKAAKTSLADRLKADPALRDKYLKNPGLRSKLPESYLTPAQRKQRILNARLNAPITPGSSVTGRDLARESNAATALRYGPQERALTTQQAQARQQGVDQAGWYAQYQADLQKHATNTGQISAAAVGQMNQTGAGLRGLDQANLTQQQGALNADAASRGATAGNLGPEADAASKVRQQMLAGFANQQSATGAANQTFADTNANVVAPAQKLRARAQSAADVRAVGDKLVGLAADKGAYQQQYRAGARSDEAKNVLAQQALGLNEKKAQTSTALDVARLTETQRSNRASESATQRRLRLEAERVQIAKNKKSKVAKTKPGSGPGSLPSAAEDKKVNSINGLYNRLLHPSKVTRNPTTGEETRTPTTAAAILEEAQAGGVAPDYIIVAQSLLNNGGKLDKKGVDAAHRLGLHVNGRWKITSSKQTATPKTPVGGVAGAVPGVSG